MKALFKSIAPGLFVVSLLLVGLSIVSPEVGAACTGELSLKGGVDCAQGNDQPAELFTGDNSIFRRITNILLFLVGAISVIMLIIGGIRYVISGGDQNQVTSAKNTILYAIVGIVVAFLAYAAVNFVTTQLLQASAN